MTQKQKLLIIEDEEPIRIGLIDVFLYHGFEVDSASDGAEGLQKALDGDYDLIILDVMLPTLDGFSVCNEIRKVNREQPIVMLTAKSSDEDIIMGLQLGADDYISKPFSVQELVLRVEAVLRRAFPHKNTERDLLIGEHLVIDTCTLQGRHAESDDEDPIEFTRREVEILAYLLANRDRPVPRGELLTEVWGYKRASNIETRTVDIHIAKIRRKIEKDPKNPTILVTMRGEGYRLMPEGSHEQAE